MKHASCSLSALVQLLLPTFFTLYWSIIEIKRVLYLLQVALGLITAKASHVVWPPSRWQQIKSFTVPDRLLLREPSAVVCDEQTGEFEETLLTNDSNDNCDCPKHCR